MLKNIIMIFKIECEGDRWIISAFKENSNTPEDVYSYPLTKGLEGALFGSYTKLGKRFSSEDYNNHLSEVIEHIDTLDLTKKNYELVLNSALLRMSTVYEDRYDSKIRDIEDVPVNRPNPVRVVKFRKLDKIHNEK